MADPPQEVDEIQTGAVELLTTRQICERLQISVATFRRLKQEHKIPSYRLGARSYRFDPVEVMRIVDRLVQ